MELRSRRLSSIESLPGGDRRGAPGADAGCHSMRTIGGRGLSRRVPTEKNTTAETNSNSPDFTVQDPVSPAEAVSQGASFVSQPATTKAGKPRVRMKWDNDVNLFIMRTYYYITKLETDKTMYCKRLFDQFRLQYPETNVTAQRIADQRRAIIRNKLLSDETLQQLKIEIAEQLKTEVLTEENSYTRTVTPTFSNTHNVSSTPLIEITDSQLSLHVDTQSQNQHHTLNSQTSGNAIDHDFTPTLPLTDHDLDFTETSQTHTPEAYIHQLEELLTDALTQFAPTDPATRPKLPKLKTNRKLFQLVGIFNEHILHKFYSPDSDLTHIHTLIYCTAFVISKQLGFKMHEENSQQHRRRDFQRKPAWKIRLENDITKLRADIGRLTQYINNNRSTKVVKAVELIFKNVKLHTRHEKDNARPEEYLDTLKQKLTLKAHRLKRYNKALTRKEDNKMFAANEKGFYRSLNNNKQRDIKDAPTENELREFWAQIWENRIEHNDNAKWIEEEANNTHNIEEMVFSEITTEDIYEVTKKMKNWKAAGIDSVHNFWFKKLNSLHNILAKIVTNLIKGTTVLPPFVTKGLTHMLPKSQNTADPSQYRPITCLPTIYKLITSCITNKIIVHLEAHKIIAEEQKGCRRNHMGCKEQLIIDSTILKHASSRSRNLSIGYIDYKKAFDSVPHSWLIKVLKLYKINPSIISFLQDAMANWTTTLNLTTESTRIITPEIQIRNGIFQGDSLSPLWFCLALNPLSNLLSHQIGYKLTKDTNISHLMYMDDIKLFTNSEKNLQQLIDITSYFSKDINMKFGLDKCRKLHIKRGKIVHSNIETEEIRIPTMDEDELYKYLGVQQSKGINHINIKKQLTGEYFKRLNLICKRPLYSKNLFKAINTFAIPILTYSFGIIKWTLTDLKKLEMKTRSKLSRNRYAHPKSAIERMTLERKIGEQTYIDKDASSKWLQLGYLFPETEGFLVAIQDQVINTKNYRKFIFRDSFLQNDSCRKCHRQSETIQHITGACMNLAQTDYTYRHNQVANIIHQKLALKHKLLTDKPLPYYTYDPKPVLENTSYKLYYDRAVLTDKTIHYNKPDIILQDKINKTTYIIDIALPNTHNIQKTITDKLTKYIDLKQEILRIWKQNKVVIVPLVLSNTGVVPHQLRSSLNTLDLPTNTYYNMQKAAILNTCRIVRRFLEE
ncbi:hypothetical protein ABMA27_008500 [Loxostege sticticalis]|uniref:Reverse transcriptase domain-containing protein n=1 Tax=Loxostege sticticalis TaxID=481309 RepID=A0ABR3HBS5_LOXSC